MLKFTALPNELLACARGKKLKSKSEGMRYDSVPSLLYSWVGKLTYCADKVGLN